MPPLGGTLIQVEHHCQHGDAGEAAAGLVGPCAHGGKRRFDRIGRANVASVLGREIIKCQDHLAILGQALGRLGILRFIDGNEQVKGHLRPLPVWRHPDRLEALFGLRLEVLGQFV